VLYVCLAASCVDFNPTVRPSAHAAGPAARPIKTPARFPMISPIRASALFDCTTATDFLSFVVLWARCVRGFGETKRNRQAQRGSGDGDGVLE
jgi:hypothetical protein